MSKLDSILKKNKDIKEFRVFDTETEWKVFLDIVENQPEHVLDHGAKSKYGRTTIKRLLLALSVMIALICIFYLVLKEPPKLRTTLIAAQNQVLELPDGSIISLIKGSKVEYPLHFRGQNERRIQLEGNATFDVKKSILPFKIYSHQLLIEVLGTKFVFSIKKDTIWIENIEGIIKVAEIKNLNNSVVLEKGEKFQYQGGKFIDLNVKEEQKEKSAKIENKSSKVIPEIRKEDNPEESEKPLGSVYKLGSVLKDYLVKNNKKIIKIDKKFKYNPDQRVKLYLSNNFEQVIQSLKNQGIIDTRPGDCPNCIVIIAPVSAK